MIIDTHKGKMRPRKTTKMVSQLAGSVLVDKRLIDADLAVTKAKKVRFSK